ncbi:MAG: hypothetical protein H0U49_05250 [Parachlamydiaceae bacterium]|nr:hypothetical protein [Parachlamydiaceae bacterium]
MLKKTFTFIFSFLAIALSATGYQSDFVDYDFLAQQAESSSYTDHIPHWRRLFNTMKVRGMLECGCGYSTAYFMDHAEKVISIEYITPGYGDDWYQVCVSLFADRPNWIPMTYNANFRSNSFNNACAYQCAMHQDYALIDPTYLNELDRHFKEQIKNAQENGYPIDVAFVDPGVYVRGDLVKLLLKNNVPIVAAHDTASDNGTKELENLYGWNKVSTPANYVKIYIPYGQGTTFWINAQLPVVVASLLAYRDAIIQLKDNGGNSSWEDITRLADMSHFLP